MAGGHLRGPTFFFLSRLTRICPPYHSQSKMAVGSSALALCSFVDVGHSGAGSKEGEDKARRQLRDTQVTISPPHTLFPRALVHTTPDQYK